MRTPQISFEFFPPKTDIGMDHLLQTAAQLSELNSTFFSVTFGAAGSMQSSTLNTVFRIKQQLNVETAPHISCVSAKQETIRDLLHAYIQQGVSRLVVLRGDIPSNSAIQQSSDFQYAADLVQFIRQETLDYFHIEVACHPEFHPETTNLKKALFHFKEKCDAGANSAITQYFYNPDAYFRFRDSCEQMRIHIPITPGIMPIMNYEKLMSFSKACGAEIPRWLNFRLESYQDNINDLQKFGEEVVSDLCEKLLMGGAPGLHFYTLNKAELSMHIVQNIGLSKVRTE